MNPVKNVRVRNGSVVVDLLASIEVSKDDVYFMRRAAVLVVDEKWLFLNYNKEIPNWSLLKMGSYSGVGFRCTVINPDLGGVIVEAIESYKTSLYGGEHVQPYTYLVAYCKAKMVDLIELNLLSV